MYLAQVHEYAQITIKVFHAAKMQDMEVYRISAMSAITAYLLSQVYIFVLKN